MVLCCGINWPNVFFSCYRFVTMLSCWCSLFCFCFSSQTTQDWSTHRLSQGPGKLFSRWESFALPRSPKDFINLLQMAKSSKGVDCLHICFSQWRLGCSWDRVRAQKSSLERFYPPAQALLWSLFVLLNGSSCNSFQCLSFYLLDIHTLAGFCNLMIILL